jgi:hypothetical protein
MSKFKNLNSISFKFLALFLIIISSLMYLFYNRELVYPGDLTGSQVRLMALKDKVLGIDSTFYLDRIELPLAMFYTDSPFEVIDYQPEKGRTPQVLYEEDMIVLAKKGRAGLSIPGIRTTRKILGSDGDWELFYYESEYEVDKALLDLTRKQLSDPTVTVIEQLYLKNKEAEIVTKMKNSAGVVMYYAPISN